MPSKNQHVAQKVVSINWVNPTERYVVVPRNVTGNAKSRFRKVIKPLKKKKGNCYFTCTMPHALIQFVYRCAKKLDLQKKVLIFSRGSIRKKNRPVQHAISITHLDWDVGVSFIVPLRLRYDKLVTVEIEAREYVVRLMELAILGALLSVAFPSLSRTRCNDLAIIILVKGWKHLENQVLHEWKHDR